MQSLSFQAHTEMFWMGEGFSFPAIQSVAIFGLKKKNKQICDFKVELWFYFRNIVNNFQTPLKQTSDSFCCMGGITV